MLDKAKVAKRVCYTIIGALCLFSASTFAQLLPENLKWENGAEQPVFASDKAIKGGTMRFWMPSYPPTFRVVGPNSNGAFRSYILSNNLPLITMHPNTKEFIPQIATEWAIKDDNKTVYFKLNPKARWTDGTKVTADDFVYARAFHMNTNLKAPWYLEYYSKQLSDVTKYDDYTISVSMAKAKSRTELLSSAGDLRAVAKHYYEGKIGKDWVKEANWAVAPNTGPYFLSKFKKGKTVTFERKKDWWAQENKFEKNRYNVDKIRVRVIRDQAIAYQHFLKGKLDSFEMGQPIYWHEKSKTKEFKNGYIKKILAYNDTPRVNWGIYLNTQIPLLSDLNVRLGLQHSMNIQKGINKAKRGDFERLPQFTSGNGIYQAAIEARLFDLQKAEEYFTKAGWHERDNNGIRTKDGQTLSLELMYNGDQQTDFIVILREEAKKAGVDLVLNKVDFTTRIRITGENKHQAVWGGYGVGPISPMYWQFFHSDNAGKPNTNNTTNMADPELDKIITAYREGFDTNIRTKQAQQIQQIVHDSGIFVPGYQTTMARAAYWRWVHVPEVPITRISRSVFEPTSSTAVEFGLYWIDKKEKKSVNKAKKKGKKFEPVLKINETFRVQPGS